MPFYKTCSNNSKIITVIDNQEFIASAVNPDFNVFIKACAGSGKTFLLTHRILAILLQNPHLKPSKILAITFTNLAAQEMKERLLLLLEELAFTSDLSTLEQKISFLQELSVIKKNTKNEDILYYQQRAKQLWLEMEQFSVLTFDAWFGRVLNLAPFCYRQHQPIIYDDVARQDYVWCVWEANNTHLDIDSIEFQTEQPLLHQYFAWGGNWESLKNFTSSTSIADLLLLHQQNNNNNNDKVNEISIAEGKIQTYLNQVIQILEQNEIISDIKNNQTDLGLWNKPKLKTLKKYYAFLEKLSIEKNYFHQNVQKEYGEIQNFIDLIQNSILENSLEKIFNEQKKSPKNPKTSIDIEWFLNIRHQLLLDLECFLESVRTLYSIFHQIKQQWILQEWIPLYLKMCPPFAPTSSTFSTQTASVLQLFSDENQLNFLHRIEQSYQHVLIDEVQDMNLLQWNIMQTWLTATNSCTLFMVGDIWQSIYRFRGTYFGLFEQLQKFILHQENSIVLETTHTRRNSIAVNDAVQQYLENQGFPKRKLSTESNELGSFYDCENDVHSWLEHLNTSIKNSDKKIFILANVNADLAIISKYLTQQGIHHENKFVMNDKNNYDNKLHYATILPIALDSLLLFLKYIYFEQINTENQNQLLNVILQQLKNTNNNHHNHNDNKQYFYNKLIDKERKVLNENIGIFDYLHQIKDEWQSAYSDENLTDIWTDIVAIAYGLGQSEQLNWIKWFEIVGLKYQAHQDFDEHQVDVHQIAKTPKLNSSNNSNSLDISIQLLTLFKAKGLEADEVFFFNKQGINKTSYYKQHEEFIDEKGIHQSKIKQIWNISRKEELALLPKVVQQEYENELQLDKIYKHYVAMTRAKSDLYLCSGTDIAQLLQEEMKEKITSENTTRNTEVLNQIEEIEANTNLTNLFSPNYDIVLTEHQESKTCNVEAINQNITDIFNIEFFEYPEHQINQHIEELKNRENEINQDKRIKALHQTLHKYFETVFENQQSIQKSTTSTFKVPASKIAQWNLWYGLTELFGENYPIIIEHFAQKITEKLAKNPFFFQWRPTIFIEKKLYAFDWIYQNEESKPLILGRFQIKKC